MPESFQSAFMLMIFQLFFSFSLYTIENQTFQLALFMMQFRERNSLVVH